MPYEQIQFITADTVAQLNTQIATMKAAGWELRGNLVVWGNSGTSYHLFQMMATGNALDLYDNQVVMTDGDGAQLYGHDGSTNMGASAWGVVSEGQLVRALLDAAATVLKNGASVSVRNSQGADAHTGTAVVQDGGTMTGVNLAATVAMVDSGDTLAVQNSAGSAVAGNHSATVSAGGAPIIKLDSSIAPLANAGTVPVQNSAGTAIDDATLAIAGGVVASAKLPATDAVVKNNISYTIPLTNTALIAIGTGISKSLKFTVAGGLITGVTVS